MPEVYVLSGGSITVLCIPTLMMHAVSSESELP